MALCFVIGNARERNENQWNCTGDMINPYDMNRVNRSKSKGGGPGVLCGIRNSVAYGLFSSYSGISMPSEISFCSARLRRCRDRMAVSDCATVSAIPPNTWSYHILAMCTFGRAFETSSLVGEAAYSIGDHYGEYCDAT